MIDDFLSRDSPVVDERERVKEYQSHAARPAASLPSKTESTWWGEEDKGRGEEGEEGEEGEGGKRRAPLKKFPLETSLGRRIDSSERSRGYTSRRAGTNGGNLLETLEFVKMNLFE